MAGILQVRYRSSPGSVDDGETQDALGDAAGRLAVTVSPSTAGTGLSFGSTASVVRIPPTASNGATVVPLVAASGSTVIYPTTLLVSNPNTTGYWVYFRRGIGTDDILQVFLGPYGSFAFDGRGDVRTGAGERLAFYTEAGATNTIICSGAVIQE